MKKNLLASTLGLALTLTGTASANIIMTGDYVLTQVSNDGTLGNRGVTEYFVNICNVVPFAGDRFILPKH